ncbi:TetR family transcriptional regulator [Anopheles sinensis]|uniref:TetR family transcriptional regulator n=1 Tax=Anopheles sinensis TaxID=74873 RepID=A0A084VPZ8_ANOSI|nr:TetR family transcriptional regulator [Anopheles sinensis]
MILAEEGWGRLGAPFSLARQKTIVRCFRPVCHSKPSLAGEESRDRARSDQQRNVREGEVYNHTVKYVPSVGHDDDDDDDD